MSFLTKLNSEIERVHEYAKGHGWWDKERSTGTLYALFHTEVSEAVEEERNPQLEDIRQRDIFFLDVEGNAIRKSDIVLDNAKSINLKPEGTGVELVDMVIRILDYLGYKGYRFPSHYERNLRVSVGDLTIFTELHASLSAAYGYTVSKCPESELSFLVDAMCLTEQYFDKNGWDFWDVFNEKHDYNTTRSHRHGGKEY